MFDFADWRNAQGPVTKEGPPRPGGARLLEWPGLSLAAAAHPRPFTEGGPPSHRKDPRANPHYRSAIMVMLPKSVHGKLSGRGRFETRRDKKGNIWFYLFRHATVIRADCITIVFLSNQFHRTASPSSLISLASVSLPPRDENRSAAFCRNIST